ncbi:MAG: GNAT family N-acetyltransferase [Phreatobacter sp.]
MVADIVTERLVLKHLSVAMLEATGEGDRSRLETLLGAAVPDAWFEEADLAAWRREDLRDDPGYAPWSIRAICAAGGGMVGHAGFHEQPAAGVVEMGYLVFPDHRRQGIAGEAIRGLMDWARTEAAIRRFVLSVAPGNAASIAIARRLGFRHDGGHQDPVDGWEDTYVLDLPAAP